MPVFLLIEPGIHRLTHYPNMKAYRDSGNRVSKTITEIYGGGGQVYTAGYKNMQDVYMHVTAFEDLAKAKPSKTPIHLGAFNRTVLTRGMSRQNLQEIQKRIEGAAILRLLLGAPLSAFNKDSNYLVS